MKIKKLALAIVVLICLLNPCASQAQAATSRALDLMLVLDNSGSMKKNDPDALMSKAVSAFAGSLPPESRLGIVVFDQEVRPALVLTPTSAADFKARVAQALRGINYRGQWTDIAGGVERAIYELRQQGRADAQRAVILFTDGVLETGNAAKDAERSRWLQDHLAAEAKQLRIRIFGIAFTEGADFRLLQSVAQTTGAEHYRVLKAAEISAVFERVRSRIQQLADDAARRDTVQVPTAGNEPGAAVSPPAAPSVPWLWLVALLIAGGAVVWVVAVVRVRPAVTGSLRDVGGHSGRKVHPLRRKLTRIGRDPAHNDLVIAHDTMSAQHAEIEIRGANFYLKDLSSSNHTYVNDKELKSEQQVLKHGDKVRFDTFEFAFSIDGFAAVADASGASVTPGGTRLRDPAAGSGPAAARQAPSPAAGAAGVTRVKTGKCNVHKSWDAVAVCSRCGFEKCRACLSKVDGADICIDCVTAAARP